MGGGGNKIITLWLQAGGHCCNELPILSRGLPPGAGAARDSRHRRVSQEVPVVPGDPSDPKGDREAAGEGELVGGMSPSWGRGGDTERGDTHSSARLAGLAGVALKSLGTLEGRRWHQRGGRVPTQRPLSLAGAGVLTGAPEGPGGPRGPMGPWGKRQQCHGVGGRRVAAPPSSAKPEGGVPKTGTVPITGDTGSPVSQDGTHRHVPLGGMGGSLVLGGGQGGGGSYHGSLHDAHLRASSLLVEAARHLSREVLQGEGG